MPLSEVELVPYVIYIDDDMSHMSCSDIGRDGVTGVSGDDKWGIDVK